jgi:hypothetical protein
VSETPRTDKAARLRGGEWVVPVVFVERMECDLNAAKVEVALVRVENDRVRSDIDRIRVEVEQRTAERDEARRKACVSEARLLDERDELVNSDSPYYANNDEILRRAKEIAAKRGWDCFKEEA